MKRLLLKFPVIFIIVCLAGHFHAASGGDKPSRQKESPYFSNDDIEKYKTPPDYSASKTKAGKTDRKEETKTKEQQDKEYWCKKAAHHREKIEKSRKQVDKTEKHLAELKEEASREIGKKRAAIEKNIKNIRKKLSNIQRQLKEQQEDLERLEAEAHRKGIPPGWLRCQFTY